MSNNLERVYILIQQKRYELAEKELRNVLAQAPEDPEALSLMALCYLQMKRIPEGIEMAQKAIAAEPSQSYNYYILSSAYAETGDFKQAEELIRQAIALNPYEADYFQNLALLHFNKRDWEKALETVEHALQINAEHVGSLNLRARILLKMDRNEEAANSFNTSFSRDPYNAHTHANQGWAKIENGQYEEALQHFSEALRINPNLEYAKTGIVEAMKAKNPIYAMFLKFNVALGKMSGQAQMGLIIGLVVVANIIPILLPIYLVFVLFSWFSSEVFDSLLRLNTYGRNALSEQQITTSNFLLLLVGIGAFGFVSYYLLHIPIGFSLGWVSLGLLFPVIGTLRMYLPSAKRKSSYYMYGTIFLGVVALFLEATTGNPMPYLNYFTYAVVGYTWVAQFLR
ncbi:MAG: tetratricopeptide repeat protein [Chitinophagales bacterium]